MVWGRHFELRDLESKTKLGKIDQWTTPVKLKPHMGGFLTWQQGIPWLVLHFDNSSRLPGERTLIASALCSCALDCLWPKLFLCNKPGHESPRSLCWIWEPGKFLKLAALGMFQTRKWSQKWQSLVCIFPFKHRRCSATAVSLDLVSNNRTPWVTDLRAFKPTESERWRRVGKWHYE